MLCILAENVSIYISYTRISIRNSIDFSLQVYAFNEKLSHASKGCLDIKLVPLPAFSICLFFSLNEAVSRVFCQNIKNSIYAEVICL